MATGTEIKQTQLSVRRRRPSGAIERIMRPVVQRAPIRASTYSAAERLTIVELMIFCLVEREIILTEDINHSVMVNLQLQKCENLMNLGADKLRYGKGALRIQIADVWRQLVALKLLNEVKRVSRKQDTGRTTITPKGKRHIKKQPKRLFVCAQKLVYTDLLEKLGRAVS